MHGHDVPPQRETEMTNVDYVVDGTDEGNPSRVLVDCNGYLLSCSINTHINLGPKNQRAMHLTLSLDVSFLFL